MTTEDCAANMRAAIMGVKRLCWNCKFFIPDHNSPWCHKHERDPAPNANISNAEQRCEDWVWKNT